MEVQVSMGHHTRATRATEAAGVGQATEITELLGRNLSATPSTVEGLEEIPVGLEEEFHQVFEEKVSGD